MSVRRLTTLALFTTLSLAVYAIESAIPPLVAIPGIKLGLANIITLILLKNTSAHDTLMVLIARLLLSALLFGGAVSFIYSLAGGMLSLLIMTLISRILRKKYQVIWGAFGGISHNLGQIAAAFAITQSPAVLLYLPFLIVSGLITGIFTGLCAHFLQRYMPRIFNDFHQSAEI